MKKFFRLPLLKFHSLHIPTIQIAKTTAQHTPNNDQQYANSIQPIIQGYLTILKLYKQVNILVSLTQLTPPMPSRDA
jgi:hypothetical protein